ncbi:hypothetical protein F4802DRAFT_595789 [Xylaria palmicola]|nr:hypothetical protein F4802DRAFT_595789 [Xylaria palmicola]
MFKRDDGTASHDTLVIVLSTVFGIIGIVLIVLMAVWCLRSRRRHRLFNRGLTPIGDDEIATWKVSRAEEKEEEQRQEQQRYASHGPKESTGSARIQYQRGAAARPSIDTTGAATPRSFIHGSFSMDLPRAPEAAAFARAPNARTGLTDEAVPGDAPYIVDTPLKRQPSRLQKLPPGTPKSLSRANSRSTIGRTRAARSQSHPDNWQGQGGSTDSSPRASRDASSSRGGHSRIYSSSSIPPRLSSGDDKEMLAGLSPPPARRYDVIGRALG